MSDFSPDSIQKHREPFLRAAVGENIKMLKSCFGQRSTKVAPLGHSPPSNTGQTQSDASRSKQAEIETLIERVVLKAASKSFLKLSPDQLEHIRSRFLRGVWAEVQARDVDVSAKRLKRVEKKILTELLMGADGKDLLLLLLVESPALNARTVRIFTERLLEREDTSFFPCACTCCRSSHLGPSAGAEQHELVAEVRRARGAEEEEEEDEEEEADVCKAAVGSALRGLIAEAFLRSRTSNAPDRLHDTYTRLLQKIWAQVEGRDVAVCPNRLEKLPGKMFARFSSETGGNDLLLLMYLGGETSERRIVSTFVGILLEEAGAKQRLSMRRPLDYVKKKARLTAALMTHEDREEEKYKMAAGQVLKRLINEAVVKADAGTSAEQLQETYDWLLQKTWAEVQGHTFSVSAGKLAVMHRSVYRDFCRRSFVPEEDVLILLNSRFPVVDQTMAACLKRNLLKDGGSKKSKDIKPVGVSSETPPDGFVDSRTGGHVYPKDEPPADSKENRDVLFKMLNYLVKRMIQQGNYLITTRQLKPQLDSLHWSVWTELQPYGVDVPKGSMELLTMQAFSHYCGASGVTVCDALPFLLAQPDQAAKLIRAFRISILTYLGVPPLHKVLFNVA